LYFRSYFRCILAFFVFVCLCAAVYGVINNNNNNNNNNSGDGSEPMRMDYSLPRLRTKFGERAFSHAGPATWNALPDHFRTVADPVKFRKLLKSHCFSQAFNI